MLCMYVCMYVCMYGTRPQRNGHCSNTKRYKTWKEVNVDTGMRHTRRLFSLSIETWSHSCNLRRKQAGERRMNLIHQARHPVPSVPRLPRKTTVDVSLCHACHAERTWMSPSATPATQNAAASRATKARPSQSKRATQCHLSYACHAKRR